MRLAHPLPTVNKETGFAFCAPLRSLAIKCAQRLLRPPEHAATLPETVHIRALASPASSPDPVRSSPTDISTPAFHEERVQ